MPGFRSQSSVGDGGGVLVSQVRMAWIRGPGFLRDRGKVRLLVNRRPAVGVPAWRRFALGKGIDMP